MYFIYIKLNDISQCSFRYINKFIKEMHIKLNVLTIFNNKLYVKILINRYSQFFFFNIYYE